MGVCQWAIGGGGGGGEGGGGTPGRRSVMFANRQARGEGEGWGVGNVEKSVNQCAGGTFGGGTEGGRGLGCA